MLRVVQHHLSGALPVPRTRKPGLHFSGWISVVQGEGAAGYFQPDRIAGGKNTGGGLEIDFPVVNGVRGVALLAEKIGRACYADAYEISLTVGPHAHQFAGEVGMAGRGDCVELELGRSEYVEWLSQGRTAVDQEVVA